MQIARVLRARYGGRYFAAENADARLAMGHAFDRKKRQVPCLPTVFCGCPNQPRASARKRRGDRGLRRFALTHAGAVSKAQAPILDRSRQGGVTSGICLDNPARRIKQEEKIAARVDEGGQEIGFGLSRSAEPFSFDARVGQYQHS